MKKVKFVIISLFFMLTGCGGSGGSEPIVPPVESGNTLSDIEFILSQVDVPGISIAVINNYEVVETFAVGVIDQSNQQLVTEQTVFQAASISKTIAAMAIIKWATENQIPLNSDVNQLLNSWHLPENGFTEQNKANIGNILSHTAGINVSGFPGYNSNTSLPTLVQILNGDALTNTDAIKIVAEPTTQWKYSGGGYTVLQKMIEDQTGLSFKDFMHQEVIEFLGLSNSTFEQNSGLDSLTRSSGHIQGASTINGQYHIYPELAAAGFWSNAHDLAQIAIQLQLALKNESHLLTSEQAQQMLTSSVKSTYGMGLELFGNGYFGHTGSNEGFRSLMRLNHNGYGLIVLTNSDDAEQLTKSLIKLFADKYSQ